MTRTSQRGDVQYDQRAGIDTVIDYGRSLEWDESKHPRADDGKFSDGGGGDKSRGEHERPVAISERVARHKGVEMVSVADLEKFRTQDRRVEPKGEFNITESTETLLPRLTKELRDGAEIQEPLELAYDTKGRVLLMDGNTRLAAIADAGFTHAPVLVRRQELHGFGHPTRQLSPAEAGISPYRDWLLPSEIGLSTLKKKQ